MASWYDDKLFHTRCHVRDKVCTIIIGNFLQQNIASIEMVEKLNLPTVKHSRPCKLSWLQCDYGEVVITEQVRVSFSLGMYKDEVLCDVTHLTHSHIMLGKSWQKEIRTNHDQVTNRYSFTKDGRRTIPIPLSPSEVYEDFFRMKKRHEEERELKKEREIKKK